MDWKPLVICPDRSLREPLREALAAWQGVELEDYAAPEAAVAVARRHQCNVCFLDGATCPDQAQALIAAFVAAACPVVVVEPNEEGPPMLRALRQGAADFLIPPFSAAEIGRLLGRLGEKTGPASAAQRRFYVLVPGKGSCGCTTLVANLGRRLAAVGSGRVLVADFDVLTGSLAFQLNLRPAFSVLDAVAGAGRLDEDLWARMVAPAGGLDLLAAPEEAALPPSGAPPDALVEFWRRRYAATLADCPLWGGEWTAGLARQADRVLVVTTNELAAMYGTRRTLGHLERSGVAADRLSVVVSRYHPGAGLDRDAVARALRRVPVAFLPNDFAGAQRQLLEGGSLHHASDFAAAVARLAAWLLDPDAPPARRRPGGARGFLSVFSKKEPANR